MFFLKAHGTGNDFVVLPDVECVLRLTTPLIRQLCDRRRGIGADGVIRISKAGDLAAAGELAALPEYVALDDWFMDYRNADGSTAEMCGNGARVFVHMLRHLNLADFSGGHGHCGTRAGRKEFILHSYAGATADVEIALGEVSFEGVSTVYIGGYRCAGLALSLGNPHIACLGPSWDAAQLAALDLAQAPQLDESFFPEGANVEVLTPLQDGAIHMRVYERGVGETLSCGTGTVAAAYAAMADAGLQCGVVTVRVPGGELSVRLTEEGSFLRGPSTLVGFGEFISCND